MKSTYLLITVILQFGNWFYIVPKISQSYGFMLSLAIGTVLTMIITLIIGKIFKIYL